MIFINVACIINKPPIIEIIISTQTCYLLIIELNNIICLASLWKKTLKYLCEITLMIKCLVINYTTIEDDCITK